jgi:hypothetical protein
VVGEGDAAHEVDDGGLGGGVDGAVLARILMVESS